VARGAGWAASGTDGGVIVVVAPQSVWRDETVACFAEHGFAAVEDPTGTSAFDDGVDGVVAVVVELDETPRAVEILEAWRSRSSAAVFAVGDTSDEVAVLAAYEAGADHVAPREVSPRQMLARVRAVLRSRVNSAERAGPCAAGPVRVDADRMVALIGEVEVSLTSRELEVLNALVERSGRLLTRADLRAMVAGPRTSERAVDFFIRRLRSKLEAVEGVRRIQVVRGVGFRFDGGTPTHAACRGDGSHAAI
jgi:two-component system response regulator RegX3